MRVLNLSKVNFTNTADQVESNQGKFNHKNSTVNTWKYAHEITGKTSVLGDFGFEVLVDVADKNLDSAIISSELIGQASVATNGIKNKGVINTSHAADKLVGIAKADLSATANTVVQAIALAETADMAVIADAFASIQLRATVDGIDNTSGEIHTGYGDDLIDGVADGSVSAVATTNVDVSAIAKTVAEAPISEGLTAFAQAMAISLAQANIITTGINNTKGTITTGKGRDHISAKATSDASTFSGTVVASYADATPENKALAQVITDAIAQAEDTAIALNNTQGLIRTGKDSDKIEAIAEARNTAIALNNTQGLIRTGKDSDTIKAIAKAKNTAIALDNSEGLIRTGKDSDKIEAIAEAEDKAIALNNTQGKIITGTGDDTIIANATGSQSDGIFGGYINMGYGSDRLEASSFAGGVNINMGKGNDFVTGFGDAVVDGGAGFDTLSFGAYKPENFNISLGSNNNQVIFELGGKTMTTTGFEEFNFDNGSLNLAYDQLVNHITI